MSGGHGNDKYNFEGQILVDFSSNVWFKPLPELFYREQIKALKYIVDYPHPEAAELVEELAAFHKVPKRNIWVTNGSVEGIYLLAQAFQAKKSANIYPCFTEYENACKIYNHDISYHSNKENWQKQKFVEDLVWFGNPNNPDSKTVPFCEVENLLSSNPSTIFIIDEAFTDLCRDFESAISLISKYDNLVILRSFTKSFAIPGIRLGYVLAQEEIIRKLANLSIPWSVNTLAIHAGKTILKNYSAFLPKQDELKHLNVYFQNKLFELSEVELIPSSCNYFLIRLKKGTASDLKKYLIQQHRILIRDASNFRGLDECYFRISLQAENNIDILVSALKTYFNESS